MAFAAENLRRIGFGGTLSKSAAPAVVAHFVTNDTLAAALGANYFDAAAALIPKGSLIIGAFDIDGTPQAGLLLVTANTGSAVTVAAMPFTALGLTPGTLGTNGQILKMNSGATALEWASDAT